MKTLEERLENVEAIILHKYGTLNLEAIKEKDAKFFKEANKRLDRINARIDKMNEDEPERQRIHQELENSMRELEETKKRLGFDT